VRGWSSTMRTRDILRLIGSEGFADKGEVKEGNDFQAWLLSETLLAALLGAILALFLTNPALRTHYDLPQLRLVLQTTMALGGLLVALLAAARFSAEGRRVDLLLSSGFLVSSLSAAAFAIGPQLGGATLRPPEGWAALLGGMLGMALVAVAPFFRGRTRRRDWAILNAVAAAGLVLFVAWSMLRDASASLPSLSPPPGQQPFYLIGVLALQALIMLVAVVGWGERFRNFPETADYQFLAGVLSAMDVQLFWSQHGECFASTICEAAGMGTPTIAGVNPCQDNGQVEQVLEGVTGELVGTPAQAIAALLRFGSDRSHMQPLRASTRQHAWTRWHVERVTADLMQLYQYWRSGKECPYVEVMLREHDVLMRNYRRKVAALIAEGSLRHSAWEMALWSAESWSLFAGARLVKPYFRRVLDRL